MLLFVKFLISSVRVKDIPVHYYDGLKFACMDFSSKQQKRRKALCIQTDLFLSFLITQLNFPINGQVFFRVVDENGEGGDTRKQDVKNPPL